MVPLSIFFFFFFLLVSAASAGVYPTELVDRICEETSNYTSCVNSLYSDPRTPTADQYTLAYIAVGLAYNYAVDARDFVTENNLEKCVDDYNYAVSRMAMEHDDLDSETFFELQRLSCKASRSAYHCQKAFPACPSLATRAHEFKGLCEIVASVGKLYTGGIDYQCVIDQVYL